MYFKPGLLNILPARTLQLTQLISWFPHYMWVSQVHVYVTSGYAISIQYNFFQNTL